MGSRFLSLALLIVLGLAGLLPAKPTFAAGVVGNGTPASCTDAAFNAAVAGGGIVTFNCGAAPHTIAVATTKNIAANTTINGGGLISLGVADAIAVISVNTDNVTLNLANITIRDATPVSRSVLATLCTMAGALPTLSTPHSLTTTVARS